MRYRFQRHLNKTYPFCSQLKGLFHLNQSMDLFYNPFVLPNAWILFSLRRFVTTRNLQFQLMVREFRNKNWTHTSSLLVLVAPLSSQKELLPCKPGFKRNNEQITCQQVTFAVSIAIEVSFGVGSVCFGGNAAPVWRLTTKGQPLDQFFRPQKSLQFSSVNLEETPTHTLWSVKASSWLGLVS